MEYVHPELLVEPDWLQEHLDDPGVRVIDCAALEAYRRAHITGAAHLPAHYYIKGPATGDADHGTFIMAPADFERLMRRLGVHPDTRVICSDDNNALVAARLWWVLKYYGHDNAAVLNGGWHRWLSEGRPATFHSSKPNEGTFVARARPDLIADAEYLLERHSDDGVQVMDCRTDAEWRGTNDRGNRRKGHVPGARHLEWIRFVARDDSRKFLPADKIVALLDESGLDLARPTITYCQGGIRAAHAAFVFELLGHSDVRVYDGSMRDWANRDDTPLEA